MAKNERFDRGEHIRVAVPAGVVSGNPVVVGTLVGVALTSRDADGKVVIDRVGMYDLAITGAINAGDPVYAVTSGGLVTSLTATASGNTRFGTSLTTLAGNGTASVVLGYP